MIDPYVVITLNEIDLDSEIDLLKFSLSQIH